LKRPSIYITLIFILISFSVVRSQTDSYKTLDSIYALQGQYYKSKEYQKIIDLSKDALDVKLQNAQDSILMARVTAYIGYANNKFNKFYKSIDGFKLALEYIPAEKSKGIVRTNYFILFDLMTRYYSLRQYKTALTIIDKSEQLLDNYKFFSEYRYITHYQRKFGILSALGYYDQAKKELKKLERNLSSFENLNEEQLRYGWMRYHRMSLEANHDQALYIKEANKDYLSRLSGITPIIEYHIKKLDSIYQNTESLINPKSRRQFWNLSYYVGALYYTSDYFKEIDNYEKSLNYIDKAINLSERAQEPVRNTTEFFRFKANLLSKSGQTQEAIKIIEQVEKKFKKEQYNASDLEVFKGSIHARVHNLDSAMHYYKRAISLMHNSTDHELKPDFSNFTSRYKFPDDSKQLDHMSFMLMTNFIDDEKAFKASKNFNNIAYQEFLEGQENLDLSLGNKQLFYNIIQNKLYLSKGQLDKKEEFLSNIENISNEFAWKEFTESRNIVQLPIIDSIENIEYKIRKQLVEAKKQRSFRKQDSLENILDLHQKRVLRKYPKISAFVQNTFDITKFQNLLKEDVLVLKYLFFLDQFAIVSISKSEIKFDIKPWNEKEQNFLAMHLDYLQKPSSSLKLNDSLSALLLPKDLKGFNSLIIIPDNPISNLAFETLRYKGEFLVFNKAVHYSSHLRFVNYRDEEQEPYATIFAPEYPKGDISLVTRSAPVFLEGAQKEAKTLGRLFSSDSYIGEKATKENFIHNKSQSNILHLAMHASVDDNDPALSHFNFSNGEKLYLEELYALNIPADLAVLGACNTGIGKSNDVSGMASLQRAFSYAGTKATIASLWEVPDESTSQIMISFYEYLKNGENKSSALQKAKTDYLRNTKVDKLKHPYYWAGFVLYGSDSPVLEMSNSWIWFLVGFLAVSVLFIVFRKLKKSDNSAK